MLVNEDLKVSFFFLFFFLFFITFPKNPRFHFLRATFYFKVKFRGEDKNKVASGINIPCFYH